MNLSNIKIFIAVYQAKSFAKVASDLNLAPSSVSRSVSVLEKALQVRLFNRTTRHLSATHQGSFYYHRVLPLFDELEQINQSTVLGALTPAGKLKVTASSSYGQIVLAPLLSEFKRQYPKIKVELLLSDQRLDLVSEQIDLAIRHGNLPDSSLVATKLHDVDYALVASPEFLSEAGDVSHPEQIATLPAVVFSYPGFNKIWRFSKGREIHQIAVQPSLVVSNAATIRECAKNHAGLALLADWTIQDDLICGRLKKVLPDWSVSGEEASSGIWMVQSSRHFVAENIRVFKAFLQEKLQP